MGSFRRVGFVSAKATLGDATASKRGRIVATVSLITNVNLQMDAPKPLKASRWIVTRGAWSVARCTGPQIDGAMGTTRLASFGKNAGLRLGGGPGGVGSAWSSS